MANQAIALQARAPQADILGGAIRNNAQLINTMAQQRTAERQTAVAQQQMELAQAKEAREASAAEIDMAGKKIDLYTKRAGQTLSPQGYQLLLQDLDRDAPEIAARFRANLPPERFNRDDLLRMVGSVSDNFKATYGPLETEVVQMEDGTYSVARTGGFGKPGVFEMKEFALKPSGGVPAATAPQQGGAMAQPSQGANTTPQDLMRQGVNPNSIPSGNPLSPISTGGQGQPDLGAIVQQMMQTGVISQADMGLMTQAAGPEKAQQLAQIMRANNIQIMPDEQAAPAGMRNAVFRPEEGAPMLQQAQSMDDYVDTGRAARGRAPQRRETAEEAAAKAYAATQARLRATRDAGQGKPSPIANKPAAAAPATAMAPEKKVARDTAVRDLLNAIEEAHKKGHLVAEDQSYIANMYQKAAEGRDYLPGGVAKKTSLDNISATAKQLLRLFIEKGTSGTLNTKAEQDAFLQSIGGSDSTYETRMRTLRNFAKQNGISLGGPAAAPAAKGIPQGAIDKLKQNPSLRGAFEAKYGAGSAARVLGRQ